MLRQEPDPNVPYGDLVLLGGGHAHVQVLKKLAMRPIRHLRTTLVSDVVFAPYSGMLPGYLAGFYQFHDVHFDLAAMCAKAGARFIHSAASAIDPAGQSVRLANGATIGYDFLSVNLGASPALPAALNGADVLPLKPISNFLQKWDALLQTIDESSSPLALAIVGGGAAGLEIALLLRRHLDSLRKSQSSVHLFQSTACLLPSHPTRLQQALATKAKDAGVVVHLNTRVESFRHQCLSTDSGEVLFCDYAIWATEAAAPPILRASGLTTDAAGFLRVQKTLQSIDYSNILGAGDCIAFPQPLPKSGVFAVRQARVLESNIRRLIRGEKLSDYRPQSKQLSLVTAGERSAYASRSHYWGSGRVWWHLKDKIDRKFMRRWQDYSAMVAPNFEKAEGLSAPNSPHNIYQPNTCGGCGSKVDPTTLRQVLDDVMTNVGRDDAYITAQMDGLRIAESVDMFRSFLSDSFVFGKIAVLHALSDLYAVGATPFSVQVLLQLPDMPKKMIKRDMRLVLEGVKAALADDAVGVTGGHTTVGREMQLGFAVMGTIDPQTEVLFKGGARPGDHLILTKPLGTGACLAAHMQGDLRGDHLEEVLQSMLLSNRVVLDLARQVDLHAVTDVTGFGLAGHLVEMLGGTAGGKTLAFTSTTDVPVFAGFGAACRDGHQSSLAAGIRQHVIDEVGSHTATLPPVWFDPQTSGGLLIAVGPGSVESALQALRGAGFAAATDLGTLTLRADTSNPTF